MACSRSWAVLAIAAVTVLALGAGTAHAVTIMTGTAGGPGGSHDDWNNPANWDNGIPTGPIAAIIISGLAAEADTAPPAYSGGLTLQTGSSLRVFGTDAEPAIGSGPITMDTGSRIIMRSNNGSTYTYSQAITLAGDAAIVGGQSTSGHHCTRNFDNGISGPGQLTLDGVNNNTLTLNAANTFDGLIALSTQNQGWRLEANVTGSLGIGDVTFDNAATLIIDAADAIADSGTLSLNGAKDSRRTAKVILNASDTIGAFFVDTVDQGYGTFSSATHPGIIGGTGVLTVPVPAVFDFDNDGFDDPADWNDGDATIYPGAPELPDLKDNNQDGNVDDGLTPTNTMTTDSGGDISWLLGSNWSLGHMPGANDSAIVSAGLNAQVTDLPPGFDYAGTLTLNNGATLRLNNTGGDNNLDALGQGGITMHDGSKISLATAADPDFPAIHLAGNATIDNPTNAAHHDSRYFDGPISGPGTLTVVGTNNNTFHFNADNSFSGGLIANGSDWRIEANVAGSLGAGDVSVNNKVTLQIDAADAMADAGILFLNGEKDRRKASKLIMNASDTVLGFWRNTAWEAPGTYDSSSGLVDSAGNPLISGNGTLTVSGIAVTGSAGTWGLGWSAQPNELTVNKTATDLDPFDMEITVVGGGVLRQILEDVINTTDEDWADYHILLGLGLGPDFVPSQPGDGPRFVDALSQAFPGLELTEDELNFDGGTVPMGEAADFALSIEVPGNQPFTFTLRQYPTTGDVIPEPTTLSLLGLGALLALRRRRRSR